MSFPCEAIEISSSSEESVVEVSSESECDSAELATNDRNELMFLDLSHQQIVEDEDHSKPEATAEQLEQIGKQFVESLEMNDQSNVAEKFSNVTIRKRDCFKNTFPPLKQSNVAETFSNVTISNVAETFSNVTISNVAETFSNVTIRKRDRFNNTFPPLNQSTREKTLTALPTSKPPPILKPHHQQIVKDNDHSTTAATAEQLEQIGKHFEQCLEKDDDQSNVAETFSNVTIRKRDRFKNMNTFPPLKQSIREKMEAFIALPISKPPPPNDGFLESLDDNMPVECCHSEALKFRKKLTVKIRLELVEKLKNLFNEHVFDNKLGNVTFSWSKWLGSTVGKCRQMKRGECRRASIELNNAILVTAAQVRDTLIHELCHAAAWIIDKKADNHGQIWHSWMNLAIQRFPALPPIDIYHHYALPKYTYKCSVCSASSLANSKLRNGKTFCAYCHGPLEIFRNGKNEKGQYMLKPLKQPFGFALYVKENYRKMKEPDDTHVDVMKSLSDHYKMLTDTQKKRYRKSFNDIQGTVSEKMTIS